MKILLIALFLTTLLTPSFTKTDEEKAACLAAISLAGISANADTTCIACINLCMIGSLQSTDEFEGFNQFCVYLCSCTGASESYKAAAQLDVCKSSFKLMFQITGIVMIMLLALLI